jgi:tetratricopeptide (TPR) repeat protein
MPLDDLSPQQTFPWVGEGFAEALGSHLQSSGQEVVDLVELRRHLGEKGLSPSVPLTRATVIVIGRELGAARAVVGSYRVEDGRADAAMKVIDLKKGAIVGVIEDHGELDDLLDLENRFAKNLFRLEGDIVPDSFERNATRRRAIPLEAHEKLARARMAGDPETRRALLENALEIHPDYMEARLFFGRVLLSMKNPVEAVHTLSAFKPEDFVYREAYFVLGLAYLSANQTGSAKEIFSNLTEQEDRSSFWNNLGIALLRTGDLEKAIEAFGRAVELEPSAFTYLFNLSWANWRAGKGSEALRWAREAAGRNPDDAEAHFLLSAAAAAQALPDESKEERERAVELSPALADVDASTVEGLERIAERLSPLSDALTADVGGDRVESEGESLERAKAHRTAGRFEEAVRELQQTLYLKPRWVEARLELAGVYREAGDLDRSVGEYRVALWEEETAATHLRLAEVYFEMGEHAEARAHAERALELEPESSEARDMLEELKDGHS